MEKKLLKNSCLSSVELFNYLYDKRKDNGFGVYYDDEADGYAIHISKLEVFDKPRKLWEFDSPNGFVLCDKCLLKNNQKECWSGKHCNSLYKAPQNYCYIVGEKGLVK